MTKEGTGLLGDCPQFSDICSYLKVLLECLRNQPCITKKGKKPEYADYILHWNFSVLFNETNILEVAEGKIDIEP
jgi:hypothetical protein